MSFRWSREWMILFLAWLALSLATFVVFEYVGFFLCELGAIAGCSTLSYWLGANPGPRVIGSVTAAFFVIFTWHIFDVRWRQEQRQQRWWIIGPLMALEWLQCVVFVLLLARFGAS